MVKSKYKRSRQREKILQILQNTKSHPTASWVYDELKKDFSNLSMGTVYRNINILIDQDLVRKIESGSSFDRFDANTNIHYHFFCRQCKAIYDLPLSGMPDLKMLVNKHTDFHTDFLRLDFYGICPICLEINKA